MKNKCGLSALLVFFLLAIETISMGCWFHARVDADSLLEECCAAMSALTSYRVEGMMRLVSEVPKTFSPRVSFSGGFLLEILMKEEIARLDGEVRSHYVNYIRQGVEKIGNTKTHVIEGWIIGESLFAYSQEEGWAQKDLGFYKAQNISTHFLGQEEMRLISEKAKEIRTAAENEEAVTIDFLLDEDYFQVLLKNVVLGMEQNGQPLSDAWVEEAERSAAGSRAEVRFVINKESRLLQGCRIEYSTGEIIVNLRLRPYDYDEDIEIALPQEAQQALGVQDGTFR